MKRVALFFGIVFLVAVFFLLPKEQSAVDSPVLWELRAVDTMKYSRDPSREKRNDPTFDQDIALQVQEIAKMGSTHVAIATPYDEEFLPVLQRWVSAARKNNLHVWFRGNWSGWEGWFDYPKIDRSAHIKKTEDFILSNPGLFEDGDIFMGCPECENGGPGDPRQTGDVQAYRQFLIDEHKIIKSSFSKIGKKVSADYNSMNGDVARLVMDKETTKTLGGYVVIDHYVATPEKLASDVKTIADQSGGKVVLGEFGVPIPDLTGELNEDEQAAWIGNALAQLVTVRELVGVNYWVNMGGSTAIFNTDGSMRKAVPVLTSYFRPRVVDVEVVDPLGGDIRNAIVKTLSRSYVRSGEYIKAPVVEDNQRLIVAANGFRPEYATLRSNDGSVTVVLEPLNENVWYRVRKIFSYILPF